MNELAINGVSKALEPTLNGLVNTFVTIVEKNNSTKIALAKIDSDMQEAIAKIQAKGNVASGIINTCSASIQNTLNQTSLSFEQKSAFIDKFTSKMLDVLDKI